MSEPKLAIDGTVNLRLTGNYGTPTWTELDLAKDVQVTPAWDEAEAFSRQTSVKEYAKGLLGLEFTISVRCAVGDPGYDAMMDAFADRKGIVDMMILDGPKDVTGSEGFRFDAAVFSAGQDQSIGGVLYRDFGVKPSAFRQNKAKLAAVVNSALVFTDID